MKSTIFIIVISLICLSLNSFAATYYVNPGESIQDAIDSATHGDTIIVLPGTYFENISFNGKNIVLTSTVPDSSSVTETTIIDGNNTSSVVTFDGTETSTCVLAGFTIQNGIGTSDHYLYKRGGGIYGAGCYATIRKNIISSNPAYEGGGIADCHGTILHNTVTGNSAASDGGGLYRCHGTIQGNTISGNSALSEGGGLYNCNGAIQGNTISDNEADEYGGGLYDCGGTVQDNIVTSNIVGKDGGGLYSCNGTIKDNIITQNSANYGGGGLYDCDAIIIDNTISSNDATYGAGIARCDHIIQKNYLSANTAVLYGGGLSYCGDTIQNNVISYNTAGYGGGIHYCTGAIQNNTITSNSATSDGGGLYDCDGTIGNCIIWGNTASNGPQLYDSALPTYSCIQGWTGGGDGNINDDPLFVFPAGDDYHLQYGSPCKENGDSTIDAGEYDCDGNPRVTMGWYCLCIPWTEITVESESAVRLTYHDPNAESEGTIDMGAYEYQLDLPTVFTFQSRDALFSGTWQNRHTGNDATWTDTATAGIDKRYYRVYAE